jgi:hypothetical protein
VGIGRGAADGHARRCRRSHFGPSQRGDAGLGRIRLQPQTSQRDRRYAARTLPRRPRRDAAPRLPPGQARGQAQGQACPDAAALRLAFTRTERRTLRKSDGTAVIEGRRFEVPSRYRHLSLLEVRFAAWHLTQVHLVDPHTGTVLCRLFPQDKAANASGLRRGVQPISAEPVKPPPPRGIGPLLARMIDRQAATGLPPACLPKDEGDDA